MKRLACINEELKSEKVKLDDVKRLNKELKEMLEQSGTQIIDVETSLHGMHSESDLKGFVQLNEEFENRSTTDKAAIMKCVTKIGLKLKEISEKNCNKVPEKLEQSYKKAPEKGRSQSVERAISSQCLKAEKVNMKNLPKINKEFQDLSTAEKISHEKIMEFKTKVKNILMQKKKSLNEASNDTNDPGELGVSGESSDPSTQSVGRATFLQCLNAENVKMKHLERINKKFQDLSSLDSEAIMRYAKKIGKILFQQTPLQERSEVEKSVDEAASLH